MRRLQFWLTWLLSLSTAATGTAQQPPPLSEILAEVSKVKYSDDKIAELAKRWPALDTPAGFDELVSVWELPRIEIDEIDPIRDACIRLKRHSKLADSEKGLVFARRAQATEDPNFRVWHFRRMQNDRVDDDLIPFYTQYLDDRRPMIQVGERSPESFGQINRVCDSAFGATLRVLERKKLIAENDPIYGDPAGEPTFSQRDAKIAILLPVLEQNGLMYYQQPSAAVVTRTSVFVPAPGVAPQTAPDRILPKSQPVMPVHCEPEPPPSFVWLYVSIAAVTVLGAIIQRWCRQAK